MNTLAFLLQVLALLLAALAGCAMARQGVLTGQAFGGVDVRVGRWRLVADSMQIRPTKVYYRLAVLPGG